MRPNSLARLAALTVPGALAACSCIGCASAVTPAVSERPALAFAAADLENGGACSLEGQPWVVQDEVRFAPNSDTHVAMARAVVDGRRRVVASAEGSLYTGYRVHLQTVAADGTPIGEDIEIPHEGSAIAEPSIAIDGATSRGVLSFVESNGHGFHRLAVRFDCPGAP